MNTKRILTLLIISSLFISLANLSSINESRAYTYDIIELDEDSLFGNMAFRSEDLANGRYIYVIGTNEASALVHVYVYSSSGSQLAHTTIDVNFGGSEEWIEDLSLYDNSTDGSTLLIFGCGYRLLTGSYGAYAFIITYNTLTYTYTVDKDVGVGIAASPTIHISDTFEHDNDVYCMVTIDSSTDYTKILKVDLSTGTESYSYPTGYQYARPFAGTIYGFQNGTDTELVYTVSGKIGDNTRPHYWVWDLDSDTITELAEHPINERWKTDTYLSLKYIGGGIHIQEDDKIILYHIWLFIDDDAVLRCIYHRLQFSSGGIASGNLLQQGEIIYEHDYSSTLTNTEFTTGGGYAYNSTYTHFWIITEYPVDSDLYVFNNLPLLVDDIEDFVETSFYLGSTPFHDSAIVAPEHLYSRVCRIPTSTHQTTENWDNDEVYIYSLLAEGQREYSIVTSHIPTGEYYTLTQYALTLTLRVNGQLREDYVVEFRIDNQSKGTKLTDVNGQVSFVFIVNTAGFHVFRYYVYYEGEEEYNTYEYEVFLTTEIEDEGQQTSTIMLYSMTTVLPVMFVVLMPAFLLWVILQSVSGFLMGLALGGVMGLNAGIITPATMFLIALLIILYFYVTIKKG